MRFITLGLISLTSLSLAAPLKRDFLGDVGNGIKGAATEVGNLIHSNATLSGVASTIGQSIDNPELTAARLTVIKSLSDTTNTLNQISTQANATGNTGLTPLIATAQAGVTSAHQAIDRIGDALVSGTKPATNDQKLVAVGIKDARDSVNNMAAAVTTPDSTLSSDITTAQQNVASLQAGGTSVLAAENLTFADLGLPDDFANS